MRPLLCYIASVFCYMVPISHTIAGSVQDADFPRRANLAALQAQRAAKFAADVSSPESMTVIYRKVGGQAFVDARVNAYKAATAKVSWNPGLEAFVNSSSLDETSLVRRYLDMLNEVFFLSHQDPPNSPDAILSIIKSSQPSDATSLLISEFSRVSPSFDQDFGVFVSDHAPLPVRSRENATKSRSGLRPANRSGIYPQAP